MFTEISKFNNIINWENNIHLNINMEKASKQIWFYYAHRQDEML